MFDKDTNINIENLPPELVNLDEDEATDIKLDYEEADLNQECNKSHLVD